MKPLDVLRWRPGRSAVEQTALMNEHCDCTACHDHRYVVVRWENGDAVWGPCPGCNASGALSAATFEEWAAR